MSDVARADARLGAYLNAGNSDLSAFREKGEAPDQLIAEQFEGDKPIRSRPLCPYPQVACYNGSGDAGRAENFSCKANDD